MKHIKAKYLSGVCAAIMLLAFSTQTQAQYASESFTGITAEDWTFITGSGNGPVLTAAENIDPDGQGWLRLTDDTGGQNSFVYYNEPIPTIYGLVFTFDFVVWSATSGNADGFAMVLFDAEATPSAGGFGGSLGYAQHTSNEGMGLNGGIAGFGCNTFGNYSNPTEGRIGGPGYEPNSIVLRGSMGYDRTQGYEYIAGYYDLPVLSTGNAASRDSAVIYSARLTITPEKLISVEWKPEGNEWETLVDQFECDLSCPTHIKFGFTASTGGVYSNHEIRNVAVDAFYEPECEEDSDCDDNDFCTGNETCVDWVCLAGTYPCDCGELCDNSSQACGECVVDDDCFKGVCADNVCVECTENNDCNNSLFCDGAETCNQTTQMCVPGTPPCAGAFCNETEGSCLTCLADDDCFGGVCEDNLCAECRVNADCDNGAYCDGAETCNAGGDCVISSAPCAGEFCNENTDSCQSCLDNSDCFGGLCVNNLCAECRVNTDCDNGAYCDGAETCNAGVCISGIIPCAGAFCDEHCDRCQDCLEDGDCFGGVCVDNLCAECTDNDDCFGWFCADNTCVECTLNSDCTNGNYCDGIETCNAGICESGTGPCDGSTPACDERYDECVECLSDYDCADIYLCQSTVCVPRCELTIKYKTLSTEKLIKKDKKLLLRITGEEGFDPTGVVDAGPLQVLQTKPNTKKGKLKLKLQIPKDTEAQTIPIRVGDCMGEIEIY